MIKRMQMSLVTKLMGLYTLATLALLSALGFMLYPTFNKLLSHAQNNSSITIECYKQIILTFLLGGIGSLVLGNWVAKKGLNKIHELQLSMECISVNSLDKRLTLNEWPKELKPLGSCYNDMLDRLQNAFIQLSQFSSDLAHELRHPLHNLKQMTEFSLSDPKINDAMKPLFLDYMHELDHLNKLIKQLLFLARSENHQLALHKQVFSVQDCVQKLLDFYAPVAEEKNLHLCCEGEATLFADHILFQRLLHNILANAIEYSAEKGRILVKIEKIHQQIQIVIHDEGVGIDAQHLPKLFDRLYRVDPARQHNQGLGLGLAIAQSIIKLHHGNIEIKSQKNEGTSVYLRFPREITSG